MMTASLARTVRPLRISCLALAAGLALAACEEQPVGSFKNAAFVADGSRARQASTSSPEPPRSAPARRTACARSSARSS